MTRVISGHLSPVEDIGFPNSLFYKYSLFFFVSHCVCVLFVPHARASRMQSPVIGDVMQYRNHTNVVERPTLKSAADTVYDESLQSDGDQVINVEEDETKTLTRVDTILILITNAVGLGVLSLPHGLHILGLIPGLVTIIGMGVLTGYTAYVFLQFYRCYPHIVNVADIGRVIGGRPFEILIGSVLVIMLCLCGASCVLTLSIGMNFITGHGMCTIAFLGMATLVSWSLCVPRSMKFCAWMGYPATVSIIAAVVRKCTIL